MNSTLSDIIVWTPTLTAHFKSHSVNTYSSLRLLLLGVQSKSHQEQSGNTGMTLYSQHGKCHSTRLGQQPRNCFYYLVFFDNPSIPEELLPRERLNDEFIIGEPSFSLFHPINISKHNSNSKT